MLPTPLHNTSSLLASVPALDVAAAQRRIARELSQGSRTTALLLLVGAALATVVVAALWLSEKNLPVRTQVAFAVLTAIGASWTTFFGWLATRRRLLFAYHRVIAGRLAAGATAIFTLGALTLGLVFSELRTTGLTAASLGGVLLVVALLLLRAARRRHHDLLQMRSWLEAQLGTVEIGATSAHLDYDGVTHP